jgi:hypothetical protein
MDMILLPLIDVTTPSSSLTKSFPTHSSLSAPPLFSSCSRHLRPDQCSTAPYITLSLSLSAWNGEAGMQMRDSLGHARRVTVPKVQCQTHCMLHASCTHIALCTRERQCHKDHTISIYFYYYYVLYGHIHCNAIS